VRVRYATADGRILDVAGGRILPADGRPDITIPLGAGTLAPGLINAHDHLHRNHYPRLGSPPYPDAYAWGADLHARCGDAIARARAFPRRDALLFGALKNLLGGATTVVHHDPWDPAFDHGFPVRVARTRAVHSLGFERDFEAAVRGDRHTRRSPLCIHLAEGVTPEAAEEVRRLGERGLIDDRLVAVHGVGIDPDGGRRLVAGGAALVWCPSSNRFLFGRTAPAELLRSGLAVLLGTDALLTGAGTLLHELVVARELGVLDPERLLAAVGATAAQRLGLQAPSLAPGSPADLVYFRRPPAEALPGDVSLVLVGGRPRLGDVSLGDLFTRLGVPTEALRVGGRDLLVEAPLGAIAAGVVARTPECGRILD
jgi:cytosine/adenosine deaminase-related metal-dependent hydrolase